MNWMNCDMYGYCSMVSDDTSDIERLREGRGTWAGC